MSLQLRQKVWNEFITSNKYMTKTGPLKGPGTSLVEWGWQSVNYDRINTVIAQSLPSPMPSGMQIEVLKNIKPGKFLDLFEERIRDTKAAKSVKGDGGIRIDGTERRTNEVKVYWRGTYKGVNGENLAKFVIVDVLIDIFMDLGTESKQDIYSKGSEGGFTLEHGNLGGTGQVMADFGVEGGAKKIQGLRVQKEVLNALASQYNKYSSSERCFITNWLDCNFNISDELVKKRDIKGINDSWGGTGQITLDKNTIPGTSIHPNDSTVDIYIRSEFRKFMQETGPGSWYSEAMKFFQSLPVDKALDAFSASKRADQAIIDYAIANFALVFTKTGKIDKRYKINKELLKKAKKEVGKSRGQTRKSKGGATRKRRNATGGKMSGAQKHAADTSHPLALKEMINAVLPDEILKNMGSPALNNRTGRFRNSAQVTNALVGPRGGVNIEYTYMKNPYETFEPGGAMGSTQRDPKKLIGNTIKEIAQEIMGKRFIRTRRV